MRRDVTPLAGYSGATPHDDVFLWRHNRDANA